MSGQPTVIQYWDRDDPPEDVAALMAGFEGLPGLEHRIFSRESAECLLAEHYGERQAAALRACAVPAMQSDYFRYCAVHALGGAYVDADLRCVSSPLPLLTERDGPALFGRPELPERWRGGPFEWRERVGPYRAIVNSFFAFPAPRHPLLALAIDVATANVEARVAEDVALVTGPAVFTSLYLLRELGSFDAFRRYAEGGPLASFAGGICAAVHDYDRVRETFDDVRIEPEPDSRRWVDHGDVPLSYKSSEDHWLNARGSIYR